MKRMGCLLVLLWPLSAQAVFHSPVKLEPVVINVADRARLIRGAQFFAQKCLVCHTLKYLDYDPIAREAGIKRDQMPLGNQQWSFGVAPPDLSLIARARSPRWLYTYLHSFYRDEHRPTGTNNLLTNNTAMPNPFLGLQGEQVLVVDKQTLMRDELESLPHYFNVLKLEQSGSMSPEAFDQTITDLVNFLVYAGEPKQLWRRQLGYWVLGFLVILMVLTYLLKKEYWREVK